MPSAPLQRRVTILDPVPRAMHLTQTVVSMMLAVVVGSFVRLHVLSLLGAGAIIGPIVAYACWHAARAFLRRKPCDVRVDERGLSLPGGLPWRRAALKSVEWAPISATRNAAHVRLLAPFRMLTLECTTDDDARALVEALQFAPEHRSVTFSFLPAVGKTRAWALGALAVATFVATFVVTDGAARALAAETSRHAPLAKRLLLSFLAPLGPAVALGLIVGLFLRWSTIRVDVGFDGIRVRRGRSDRFVAFSDVEWKRPEGAKKLAFKTRGEREEHWLSFVGFDAFLRRVEEVEAKTAVAASPIVLAPASSAEYRQSTYPKEVLLRVVEDRAQDLATRTTAADALRSGLDVDERQRVRLVAATTASVELREHLEQLAESDDPIVDGASPRSVRALRAEGES